MRDFRRGVCSPLVGWGDRRVTTGDRRHRTRLMPAGGTGEAPRRDNHPGRDFPLRSLTQLLGLE